MLAVGLGAWLWIGTAGPRVHPDPRLTPGAVASRDPAETCMPGYSRAHRLAYGAPGELGRYERVMRAYGVPRALWHGYELDHLVPLCLGGADTEANLWPQAWGDARRKDAAEAAACWAVCADELGLREAQRRFLDGEW